MEVNRGVWSEAEHDRFLQAIQTYPHGPWRLVAQHVGTRDIRQVQTHEQKYYEKMGRHLRGLQKERRSWVRPEHRVDDIPPGLVRPSVLQSICGTTTAATTTTTDTRVVDAVTTSARSTQGGEGETHAAVDPLLPSTGTDVLSDTTVDTKELPTLEESLDILLQCLSDY